ncbi:MAG: LysR family transcriptional regulator [Oscillospiraceae bacterium]|nr:LysR family transcriptional regulator [Oscillospiraceae bacterium]
MNTLHLKYAVEVEKTNSITQAADNLFMAQPNLSKAIKELEDNLGFCIFERTSKGVIPTQKGARFLVYAKNILDIIDKMSTLSDPDITDSQNFSISLPRSSYIWDCINSFADSFDYDKSINMNIKEANALETIDDVTNGKFDLGIIRFRCEYRKYFEDYLDNKNISYDMLIKSPYYIITSSSSDFADNKSMTLRELRDFTRITYGDNSIPYIPSAEQIKLDSSISGSKSVFVYDRASQTEMLEIIKNSYVISGLMSDEILRRHSLCSVLLSESDVNYYDLFIYRKKYQFSDVDTEFKKELDSFIRELL